MVARIALHAGTARAEVLPDMGAALAGLWAGDLPVLRPWRGRAGDGPFSVASIVLAPFSNRVSRPFTWRGRTHALPRNLDTEAFAIHGDAFARAWRVTRREAGRIDLALDDGAVGPFRYRAALSHALGPTGLVSELTLTNRSDEPMPYGAGFHPWFPRDRDTRIAFAATGLWPEDDRHLPASQRPVGLSADQDFSTRRALPAGWINNGFAGWDRHLRIEQGADAASVTLTAGALLDTLILFSPGADADFFCAEPVSHPVDALNLPGHPGLVVLAPGDSMTVSMRLAWGA